MPVNTFRPLRENPLNTLGEWFTPVTGRAVADADYRPPNLVDVRDEQAPRSVRRAAQRVLGIR
jgi:hypothetical protein